MVNPACDDGAYAAAEAVALRSRSKLIAYLAARFGDVAAAEDALSEALASALSVWPHQGCPDNPEAWLLTAARRKLIDEIRRHRPASTEEDPEQLADSMIAAADNEFPDRRLALLFACAHPAIDPAIRAPLMLQAVLGLEAAQVASAFLISPLLWPSDWCGPKRKSARPVSLSASPNATNWLTAWNRCWIRSTRALRKDGWMPQAPIPRAANWLERQSFSADS